MWRVPNSTAKAAIASATNSAMSPSTGCALPVVTSRWVRIAPSEAETALSCSAMYGIVPTIAISATVAATA